MIGSWFAPKHERIYLHCSGPLLENGLDKPENLTLVDGGFPWFAQILISFVGALPPRILLSCSLGGVVDGSQLPVTNSDT